MESTRDWEEEDLGKFGVGAKGLKDSGYLDGFEGVISFKPVKSAFYSSSFISQVRSRIFFQQKKRRPK